MGPEFEKRACVLASNNASPAQRGPRRDAQLLHRLCYFEKTIFCGSARSLVQRALWPSGLNLQQQSLSLNLPKTGGTMSLGVKLLWGVLSRRKGGRGRSGHDRVETESAGRSRSSGWVMTAGAGGMKELSRLQGRRRS